MHEAPGALEAEVERQKGEICHKRRAELDTGGDCLPSGAKVVYTTRIYGELMVNNQQYDSYEGRFDTSFARVFHS